VAGDQVAAMKVFRPKTARRWTSSPCPPAQPPLNLASGSQRIDSADTRRPKRPDQGSLELDHRLWPPADDFVGFHTEVGLGLLMLLLISSVSLPVRKTIENQKLW